MYPFSPLFKTKKMYTCDFLKHNFKDSFLLKLLLFVFFVFVCRFRLWQLAHTRLNYTSMKTEKKGGVGKRGEQEYRVRKKIVLGKNLEKTDFAYMVLSSLYSVKKSMYVCIHCKLLDRQQGLISIPTMNTQLWCSHSKF